MTLGLELYFGGMNNASLYNSNDGNRELNSFPVFPIITINFNILKENNNDSWII